MNPHRRFQRVDVFTMLKSSLASPATAAAALKDLNFWYVLACILLLGYAG
jgi:hypothetical protein